MATHKSNLTELTLAQLETITGVSYKTIKKRIGNLAPIRSDGKALYFAPQIALPMIYELGQEEGQGASLDKEKARLAKHQADRAELEVGRMRGELIPAELVEKVWSEMVMAFRAKMLNLPTKCASVVAGISETLDVEAELKRSIDEALTELAAYEPSQYDLESSAEGSEEGCATS